jgi:hydroxymethylpyrimidine/phosphomethylpyrimidine kinase
VVRAQIDSVAADLRPDALKSGMLATSQLVVTVADAIRAHGLDNYVMDPVMVATSGHRLLDEDAEKALAEELLPLASLVTPNLHEARILTGIQVADTETMGEAARALVEMGAGAALVKGGHLESGESVDLFWDGTRELSWRRERIPTSNTHGTGCTLSAAAAATLARGVPLAEAVDLAVDFVARAISTAPDLGQGHGPVNHFAGTDFRPGAEPA